MESRGDYFQFDLVFIKKIIIKPNFFLKKPKPVQTNRFRFGFLGQKLIQTSLAWFFPVWLSFFWFFSVWVWFGSVSVLGSNQFDLVFFGLALFLSGLAWFFSVWVWFGFFSFWLIKPKPNRTGQFFQNFNRFFFTVRFFRLFFFQFSRFNQFFDFFFHPLLERDS